MRDPISPPQPHGGGSKNTARNTAKQIRALKGAVPRQRHPDSGDQPLGAIVLPSFSIIGLRDSAVAWP